eukprot:gene8307-8492_t
MAPSVLEEQVAVVPSSKEGLQQQHSVRLTPSTDCLTELAGLAVTKSAAQQLLAGHLGCDEEVTAVEGAIVCSSEAQTDTQQRSPAEEAAAAEAVDAFVALYEQAYLTRAVQQLQQICQEQGIPEEAVAQLLRGRGVDLAQLQERAAEVQRGIAEVESDAGWTLIQDDGKLRLLYRHQQGTTVHCFKGSCTLPAPLEQPLAMAREFDLIHSWNSYLTNSSIVRTFCDVDLLAYASVWMPWPLAERDVLISAVADDQLKERGVIAVSFASPHETPASIAPDLPAGADKRVHSYFTEGSCMTMTPVAAAAPAAAEVKISGCGGGGGGPGGKAELGPVRGGQQQTRVVVVANVDTKLTVVSEVIIQFVLKVFAPFMYSTVVKVLRHNFSDPQDALPQRMAAHHELYDMMRRRCEDFLAGQPDLG